MSTNTYILIAVVAVVVIGGYFFLQSQGTPEQVAPEASSPTEGSTNELVVITYTDSGYSPKEVTIVQGGKVTFQNESSGLMWPATAMHPTHTVYPGSDIDKCRTEEQTSIFDACRGIEQGEGWSFLFQETGSWGFHDHLQSNHWGKINVE